MEGPLRGPGVSGGFGIVWRGCNSPSCAARAAQESWSPAARPLMAPRTPGRQRLVSGQRATDLQKKRERKKKQCLWRLAHGSAGGGG